MYIFNFTPSHWKGGGYMARKWATLDVQYQIDFVRNMINHSKYICWFQKHTGRLKKSGISKLVELLLFLFILKQLFWIQICIFLNYRIRKKKRSDGASFGAKIEYQDLLRYIEFLTFPSGCISSILASINFWKMFGYTK